ncbi:MAG: permease-like cell division protein FtsX [Ruminococcus sp.]|jgi:cell division transport system permease protein
MRISTIGYNAKQGVVNIGRNIIFSLASIATIAACVFLFGLVFSIVINFNYIVKNVEEGVTMTVFFEDGVDQATIDAVGEQINALNGVTDVKYVSAQEAWEEFQEEYFEGAEDAAEGFQNDNPLSNKANYEVTVDRIEDQEAVAKEIEGMDGVSNVNHSEGAVNTLTTFNRLLGTISLAVIIILFAVAIFLISNTISVGIAVRREEIGIMKLIGATNGFVRAPFIIEGLLIGLIGAVIPLVILYFMYNRAVTYILEKFNILSDIVSFLAARQVFEVLIPAGLILGMGIGFIGSAITIRKHLKV